MFYENIAFILYIRLPIIFSDRIFSKTKKEVKQKQELREYKTEVVPFYKTHTHTQTLERETKSNKE